MQLFLFIFSLIRYHVACSSTSFSGSASVALVAYSDMQEVLEADLFHTEENATKTIISKVVSATLEDVIDTELSTSVNFTLRHINVSHLSC